ncbi:MAG: hypothetical protein V2I43_09795, partial [Parvularcula sp.]|nr:hypothetical protein [Parvularcula sp.]
MLHVIRFIVFTLISSLTFSASAQSMQECAAMENSADRLACFDSLAQDAPPDTSSVWQFGMNEDPMDDSLMVFASTQSLEPVMDPYGFGIATHASLGLFCVHDQLSIVVFYDMAMVNGLLNATQTITYRLDDMEPKRIRATASQDMKAVTLQGTRASTPFLEDLMTADEVLVRVENL